jgi:hypothetical protein
VGVSVGGGGVFVGGIGVPVGSGSVELQLTTNNKATVDKAIAKFFN